MTTCAPTAVPTPSRRSDAADLTHPDPDPRARPESPGPSARGSRRARVGLSLLFLALVGAFAAGLWGTVVRPSAYEVRGEIVARPARDLILVRHGGVPALGMPAMDLMAVQADPALLDPADPRPGDRVRLAVRSRGADLVLVRIEKGP